MSVDKDKGSSDDQLFVSCVPAIDTGTQLFRPFKAPRRHKQSMVAYVSDETCSQSRTSGKTRRLGVFDLHVYACALGECKQLFRISSFGLAFSPAMRIERGSWVDSLQASGTC